ncbi:MAG: GH92 family glycosyl hydrolase [Williamsia sp.]|nr:GH92 family glycosyl hydrolase [Williamsia sp.]
MKTSLLFLFFLVTLPVLAQTGDLVSYVNPLMGTAASTTRSAQKHGEGTEQLANVIPAVGRPFGMIQATPQTRTTEKKCLAPYYYKDDVTTGYRISHWLSGSCTQDYGSVTIMPLTGNLVTEPARYASPYDHATEISRPHLYKNYLTRYGLQTRITATLRCAMLQCKAARSDSLYFLIIPNSDKNKGYVHIDMAKREITGYNPVYRIYQGSGEPAGFSGYFVIRFDTPFLKSGTFSNNRLFDSATVRNAPDGGGFVGMKVEGGTTATLRIGTSFTSLEGARKNLAAEIGETDFDEIASQAQASWNKALAKIQVETQQEQDKTIFYTSLYHAMQHPRLMSDVDGSYPRFAGNYRNEHLAAGNYYDDFSMWDIYRAQLPLLEILDPDLINNCVRSLILKGQQGGWLPVFPCWNSYTAAMIGDHASAFIASAFNRGIRSYDVEAAYRLMRQNAFQVAPRPDYLNGKGRRALSTYLQYGYIPLEDSVWEAFHKREQVSRTLEYAFDDYALSTVARKLNKQADCNELLGRSQNYRQVFDSSARLMNGRWRDGSFYKPFQADKKLPFITEGTPRQYSFYVPQDIRGLAGLMGGRAMLEQSLDSLFLKNEYWHGNEPGHHIPFLYNYTASPYKTGERVAAILRDEYSNGPGGLSGNDDAGQMSAWYVFAAIGLYPADPVSGEYLLTTPLFSRMTLSLPNGKKLIIRVNKKDSLSNYIQSISWNGHAYTKNYLRHEDLLKGGEIIINVSNTPNKNWAGRVEDQPSSLTSEP